MPLANISEYMRKVVSGVRSSCVTADANRARRSPKTMLECRVRPTAPSIRRAEIQPAKSVVRAGVQPLSRRPWGWLAGPLFFALGAWLSSLAG